MQVLEEAMTKKRCLRCEEKLYQKAIFHQCGDGIDYVRFDNIICSQCKLVITLHNDVIMPYSSIKHCQCENKSVKFR